MIDLGALSDRLERGPDRVWRTGGDTAVCYPASGHGACFSVEETSFWFAHRNRCVVALARAHPPVGGGVIFDVGGGNGFVAAALQRAGFGVVLVEPGPDGVANARCRGIEAIAQAEFRDAGFRDATLPAVGLFDVIEHVEAQEDLLTSVYQSLARGGRLYVSAPAHQSLWSREDELAGHHRRYRLAELTDILEQVGFSISYASYFFVPLPLPIFLLRRIPYRLGLGVSTDDPAILARQHQTGTRLAERLLWWEAAAIRGAVSLPFGASCLIAATKS